MKRCARCQRPIPEDRRADALYCSPKCQKRKKNTRAKEVS